MPAREKSMKSRFRMIVRQPLTLRLSRPRRVEIEVAKIVQDIRVATILFINLEDPCVFVVVRRKNPRRFARQKNRGEGAFAFNEATNDNHAASLKNKFASGERVAHFANRVFDKQAG
jgi:hypothetical protein